MDLLGHWYVHKARELEYTVCQHIEHNAFSTYSLVNMVRRPTTLLVVKAGSGGQIMVESALTCSTNGDKVSENTPSSSLINPRVVPQTDVEGQAITEQRKKRYVP